MATLDAIPRRQPEGETRPYRLPPANVEAEQALIGAILINNDAFDRVSDFLKSEHFVEEIHRRIYEIAGALIRQGKLATPITLKTFLGEHDIGGMTVPQYLARLATEATTVINAYDYGRAIYDLALRRELISIGEDMVNVAYDAPVDSSPREQIEETERRLYQVAEGGRYDGGFQRFADALKIAVDMAARAYERDGSLSGIATGLVDLDRYMGGLQSSDLVILAGRPGMGKTALATNIAFNIARAYEGRTRADGGVETVNGGIVGFFSLEMSAEQLATRIIAEQSGVASYKIRRGDITEGDFRRVADAVAEMQSIPYFIDQTGGISIASSPRGRASETPAGPRSPRHRLHSAPLRLEDSRRQPRSGTDRDHDGPEGARQGAQRADPRPVAALAAGGIARRQAPTAVGPARIRVDRAGRRRGDVRLREEYYLKNREPRPGTQEHIDWMTQMESAHGRAEVIIGKQRHGPTGTIELQFDAEVTRFSSLAREDAIAEIR